MTEKWASQPRRSSSFFSTRSARGLVTAEMDRAMSTSSECSRGLWWPRWEIFMSLMGAMMEAGSRSRSLSMPARALMAFIRSAADGPSRELFLPVTMRPSGSTMAPAGIPVDSATCKDAATAGQMSGVTSACCMTISSFRTTLSSALPRTRSTMPA